MKKFEKAPDTHCIASDATAEIARSDLECGFLCRRANGCITFTFDTKSGKCLISGEKPSAGTCSGRADQPIYGNFGNL